MHTRILIMHYDARRVVEGKEAGSWEELGGAGSWKAEDK